jgi:pimeloyl-ACP methyl ester carboxylesterase
VEQIELGRFPAEVERPEPIKFAWPIVLLPELFTTIRHLDVVVGYLGTLGWEVFAPDLRAAAGRGATRALGALTFADLVALAAEALEALGRDAIILGHGIGGLVALKLAERANVKAAVAYSPLVPGFRTPLFMRAGNWLNLMRDRPLAPPRGRALFELLADAEPFMRENAIRGLIRDSAAAARDVARGPVAFDAPAPAAPRLIVAGDSDIFAPIDRVAAFTEKVGAKLVRMAGRGHWLIGGRALERAIGETQRFLVRALGQDLLLLYPEEWKNDPER